MLSRLAPRWRVTVPIALGAWVVHQLRYALAHGDGSTAHLAAHSHGYLDAVGPVLVWLVALAVASWVLSLSHGQPFSEH